MINKYSRKIEISGSSVNFTNGSLLISWRFLKELKLLNSGLLLQKVE